MISKTIKTDSKNILLFCTLALVCATLFSCSLFKDDTDGDDIYDEDDNCPNISNAD